MRAILSHFSILIVIATLTSCTNGKLDASSLGLVATNFSVTQGTTPTSLLKINNTTQISPLIVACPRDVTLLEISFNNGSSWESMSPVDCTSGSASLSYNLTTATTLANPAAAVIPAIIHGKGASSLTKDLNVTFLHPTWDLPTFVVEGGATTTNKASVGVDTTMTETAGIYKLAPTQTYSTSTAACSAGGTWMPFAAHISNAPLDGSAGTANTYFQFKDEAGNVSNCLMASIQVDQTAPTVTLVTSAISPGNYIAGQIISVELDFSKTVTVANGTPTLLLKTDLAATGLATYSSGSGTSKLTFTYQVRSIDNVGAVDVASASALALNGARVRDAAGNDANLVLPVSPASTALPAQKGIQLNFIPYITSITSTFGGEYWNGEKIDFIVTWSGDITVNTAPTLSFGASGSDFQTYAYDQNRSTSRVSVFSALNSKDYVGTGLVLGVNFNAGDIVAQGSSNNASNLLTRVVPGSLAFPLLLLHASALPTVAFSSSAEATPVESDGTVSLGVTITPIQTAPTTITLRALEAPMNANGRYTLPNPLQVVIPAGSATASIAITLNDNSVSEGAGALVLSMISSTRGRIVSPSTSRVIIRDDDLVSNVAEIATGFTHSCVRYSSGKLACFGSDFQGQLGFDASTAVDTQTTTVHTVFSGVSTSNQVIRVAASANGTCAILNGGSLYCWGSNASGTIGLPSNVPMTTTPTQIAVGETVSDIQMTDSNTCAIFSSRSNSVWCWGADQGYGILGPNYSSSSVIYGPDFSKSAILTNINQMSLGSTHACALDSSNRLYCWGSDSGGLGLDSGSLSYSVYRTPHLTNTITSQTYVDVAAGANATCVRTNDASMVVRTFCWGNSSGTNAQNAQSIFGPATAISYPVAPTAGGTFSKLYRTATTSGNYYGMICGTTTLNQTYCWGNVPASSGSYGSSAFAVAVGSTPTKVADAALPFAVAGFSSNFYSCTASQLGQRVKCSNTGAQSNLIDFPFADRQRYIRPYAVSGTFKDRSRNAVNGSRSYTSCVTRPAAGQLSLECGGNSDNSYQALGGQGTFERFPSVTQIFGDGVLKAAAGFGAVCAILKDNNLWCFGRAETTSTLGDLNASPPLLPEFILSDVTDISMGNDGACAITSKGALYCWGQNSYGTVGNGTVNTPVTKPTLILASGVTAISVGYLHACAVQAGDLYCWGYNGSGALGDTTLAQRLRPVAVYKPDQKVVIQVSAGYFHTCAIYKDATSTVNAGDVKCWGQGNNYQLGRGPGSNNNFPLPLVSVMSNATDVQTSAASTCALNLNHELYCWGSNGYDTNPNTSPTLFYSDIEKFWATSFNAGQLGSTGLIAIKHSNGSALAWGNGQPDFQQIHPYGTTTMDYILGL